MNRTLWYKVVVVGMTETAWDFWTRSHTQKSVVTSVLVLAGCWALWKPVRENKNEELMCCNFKQL